MDRAEENSKTSSKKLNRLGASRRTLASLWYPRIFLTIHKYRQRSATFVKRMQSLSYIPIAILALLIAACQSASTASSDASGLPQWVTELPIKSGYAYGVGSAPVSSDEATAAQLARERARFDLVKSLKVNVSGEFYSSTELNNSELTQTVRQTIRNRVDETELTQIEIQDSYFDKKKHNKLVHAL